jgi:hypothetical protein
MKNPQNGNVLFYILIAVALLAALTFAVIQSGRGNITAVNEEKARLLATEMLDYAGVMTNAAAQLRLRTVNDTDLCFDDAGWGNTDYANASCSDDTNKIFHLKGAGVTWTRPPELAMDAAASPDNLWHIYGGNEVEEVGTTCGGVDCADLILVADELRENVCLEINKLLKIENAGGTPPIDSGIGTAAFAGTFTYANTIGDEDAALKGRTGGCFENTGAGKFTFYKVLLAR